MYLGYFVALAVLIADQVSKYVATAQLADGPIHVLPVFNLALAHNSGAAFSFLSDGGGWQRWFFVVISSAVSIMLLVWIARLGSTRIWLSLSLALILGGALGNLIDRVLYGYVIDFIQVHYQQWYFPTFNIADSGITVGAFLMIALTLFEKDETQR